MFTPPPSPNPRPLESIHCTDSPVPSPSHSPPSSPHGSLIPVLDLSQPPLNNGARKRATEASMLADQDRKRRTAWRTGLAVMILPLLLALFTLFARFASPSHILDFLAGLSSGTRVNLATGTVRSGHSPHSLHPRQNGGSATRSGEPPSTSSAAGIVFPSNTPNNSPPPSVTVPTIPSSPPLLPTPFPQPYDTTLTLNFTTNSCETFFLNMTQSLPFRQCRPFSFLSQTSTAFLQAQSNITALNIDIWGTCNTPLDADQCAANMGWFESQLLTACSQEKSENNEIILQSQASLQSYSLMRQAACIPDQNTSAYCYVEAVFNQNPSDLYFYSLPFGMPLPNNTNLSCSSCTKDVMALFGSQINVTSGLEKSYDAAVTMASSKCGSNYVGARAVASSALPGVGDTPASSWMVVFALGALFMGII